MKSILKHLALAFSMTACAWADGVYYEGRLSADGVPFEGTGHFKFALVGDDGVTLWSSADISLTVHEGVYAIRLGESAQAAQISPAVLRRTPLPKLRIWFLRERKGWVSACADVPLSMKSPASPPPGAAQPAPEKPQ